MHKLLLNKRCWIFVTLMFLWGCDNKEVTSPEKACQDSSIEQFQFDLLDTAFDTATSIPVEPHIKTRSEWQQRVVSTCMKMNQPQRALKYVQKIDNWRRGLCYAEIALYYARNSCTDKAHELLKLAGGEYEKGLQDWRRDEIKIAVARVHMFLGESDKVNMIESGLTDQENGVIDSVRAVKEAGDSFDKQVEMLDALIDGGTFEAVKNALYAYAELYNTYYTDPQKREKIAGKIRSSWNPIPIFIRYQMLDKLTEYALEHNDAENALEILDEIQSLIDAYKWPLKNRISIQAKNSLLRFRAGDRENAVAQADAVLELFFKEGSDPLKIVNIYKAEAITPLAETYNAMGNREKAIDVYKLAVDSAVENPNSRPRAEDITDILCSMALHSVEPDDALKANISRYISELSDPW